jgi:HK97 family phage prohead protease
MVTMIKRELNCVKIGDVGAEGEGLLKGSATFVASTASEDRYSDIISQDGWDLSSYRKNPVILFNHDSRALPIGKGDVEVVDGQLLLDVEFDMDDPLAEKISRKVDKGFINAVSVGFNPIRSVQRNELPTEHKYFGERGRYFERSELLEVSIVTIPANSEAIASKGIEDMDVFARMVSKHILEIIEEDDRFVISYAKAAEADVEDEEEYPEESDSGNRYDDEEDDDKDNKLNFERALLSELITQTRE